MTLPTTSSKVDLGGMRARNEQLLLRMIWDEPGVTRAELARATGLSASTVSTIVGRFEDHGFGHSVASTASGSGRPPRHLTFDESGHHIAGVEIGATHITAILATPAGSVVASDDRAFDTREDPHGTLETAADMLQRCVTQSGYRGAVLGLGVAVPSPVDLRWPGRVSPMILPRWEGVDVIRELGERTDLPVYVENDGNAGALAERWFGEGGNDLVFIKVATGIGAGLIVNGQLYRGAGGIAGELGHVSIDPAGPTCVCGNRGCLNVLLGTSRLIELAADRCEHPSPTSARALAARVREGDVGAIGLIREVGTGLGIGVAGLLNILNPRRVVLGGELVSAGDVFLDAVRESARARSLLFSNRQADLTASALGESAIALGAASLALDAALQDHDVLYNATLGRLAS